jgi:hemerythrin superfamily protein
MNAIQLLKDDHKKVKDLLTKLADTSERATKSRTQLLETIAEELRTHGRIEEDIFYPALRKEAEAQGDKETVKLITEAYEEHRAAVELVLPDLEGTAPESIEFSGRAKVLKELVEHHADEEEDEMFPKARKLFDKKRLDELGAEMEEAKGARA